MKSLIIIASLMLTGPVAADILPPVPEGAEAVSLFGEPLKMGAPSAAVLQKYQWAKAVYEAQPGDATALIWYGRRTAYLGQYRQAIEIFTDGIKKHPEDARMLRHRAHRYISIRDFDRAITDFEQAAKLIKGTENAVEPDGMPNKYNIPLSTTHGNIWYHLGLAYYLKQDFENALRAFGEGHKIATNDDSTVSTAHWLYMINRRMGREEDARKVLDDITADMKVLENGDYHRLCLFYKGEIDRAALGQEGSDDPGSSAMTYGLANWHYYSGDRAKSDEILKSMLKGSSWSAFGYIAAEADLKAR